MCKTFVINYLQNVKHFILIRSSILLHLINKGFKMVEIVYPNGTRIRCEASDLHKIPSYWGDSSNLVGGNENNNEIGGLINLGGYSQETLDQFFLELPIDAKRILYFIAHNESCNRNTIMDELKLDIYQFRANLSYVTRRCKTILNSKNNIVKRNIRSNIYLMLPDTRKIIQDTLTKASNHCR